MFGSFQKSIMPYTPNWIHHFKVTELVADFRMELIFYEKFSETMINEWIDDTALLISVPILRCSAIITFKKILQFKNSWISNDHIEKFCPHRIHCFPNILMVRLSEIFRFAFVLLVKFQFFNYPRIILFFTAHYFQRILQISQIDARSFLKVTEKISRLTVKWKLSLLNLGHKYHTENVHWKVQFFSSYGTVKVLFINKIINSKDTKKNCSSDFFLKLVLDYICSFLCRRK